MNIRSRAHHASGMTLVELLVAMGIFGVLMAIIYPTFSSVSNHVSEINDKQELTQKGQRVLDYIGEEFRLAGLFVGARPSITFCGVADINSLVHTAGTTTDAVTFLTSERIRTARADNPFLWTTVNKPQGSATLTVNATGGDVSAITPAAGTTNNAGSFITFDTLQPNLGTLVYRVTNYDSGSMEITITPPLDQAINTQSNAYSVIRKRFEVNGDREFRVFRWNPDCSSNPDVIVSSHGPGNNNGGIDGFKVEYVLANGAAVAALAAADIVNVRAVRIWMLLRSDFPAGSYYKNTTTYTLGQAGPVNVVVNDNYRRILLTKTVEVKNVGF